MNDAEKLKEIMGQCGFVGFRVLSHEAEGEQYKDALLRLLDIMKCITPEDIKAAEYMNRVTALRKVIEEVYGTEAMRFCGSDGC